MQKFYEAICDGHLLALDGAGDKHAALRVLVRALEERCGINGMVEEFLQRETECGTGLGCGLAVPHVRRAGCGEIFCMAGWSRSGLDFGAMDGESVHLVAAYCVPDARKNDYLREVSGLVRTTFKPHSGAKLASLAAVDSTPAARDFLLAWLGPQS